MFISYKVFFFITSRNFLSQAVWISFSSFFSFVKCFQLLNHKLNIQVDKCCFDYVVGCFQYLSIINVHILSISKLHIFVVKFWQSKIFAQISLCFMWCLPQFMVWFKSPIGFEYILVFYWLKYIKMYILFRQTYYKNSI